MHKLKNIEQVAERIKKAVKNNERIILYGDSDLDGISSTVIMGEAIKSLGGSVDCAFFPDRENDGYGLNENALKKLNGKAPALLITLDLGIGNVKEIDSANQMGFEVIVIDHHEPLADLPKASLIIDPMKKDDPYPFKGLANVGITFNVCMELLGGPDGKSISPNLKNSFLELAALGTIADMVPQENQNAEIISDGLKSLRNTFRPALQVFWEILGKGEESIPKMISAINSAQSVNFGNESYVFLTCPDKKVCKKMAEALLDNTRKKQIEIKNIVEEVERRVARKPDEEIIFEGDPAWKLVLAGPAASILTQRYDKPVFLFKKMDKEACGSVRNPKGTHSVDAMKSCKELLLTYGGHAQASGFRLKAENLDAFKTCLIKYFQPGGK